MLPFRGKAIPKDELRAKWELRALPIFAGVYQGQLDRIANVIRRASPETIEAFMREQWEKEPPIVKQAVQDFYDELILAVAQVEADDLGASIDWDRANEELIKVSQERARWFADSMTETSIRQAQNVIRDWLDAPGTIGELTERMAPVWTGPRPAAAAVTETTNLVAQSRHTTWETSGVVWGYHVRTMNDGLVRPSHTETAKNGPYPLSDKSHLPPIDGDVNCRCFTAPAMRTPNEITN